MANYHPLGGGQSSRGVKNTHARDYTWERGKTWQPAEPQPFVVGRDVQRHPANTRKQLQRSGW